MKEIFIEVAGKAAKDFAGEIGTEYVLDLTGNVAKAFANAVKDTVESIMTGRRTLETWNEIISPVIDKFKDEYAVQNNVKYIGGKLKYSISKQSSSKIVISCDLYYHSESKGWVKVTAKSDAYASNFTHEAIDDIKSHGSVVFDIE